jgi:hypothetical protein
MKIYRSNMEKILDKQEEDTIIMPPPIFNEPILFVSVDPGEVAGFWIWGLNSSDIGVYQRYGNGCPEWVMNGGLPKGDSPPIPVLGET